MFIDLYEILEISPNANSQTIEQMFRYFAKLYHPDNPETGDAARFNDFVEAHNTLKDPVKRAEYDNHYQRHSELRRETAKEAGSPNVIERDVIIQDKILALLYVRRRRDVNNPGIGDYELETLTGCPAEHLQFHLWYLKAKGWIANTGNGTFAITVDGVDRANAEARREVPVTTLLGPALTT